MLVGVMGRRLREHRRKGGSATLSVTDKMPVERRGDKGQPWVLLFDWLFSFEQFAKRNEALLKPDLLARGGFSENCRRRCSRSLIRPGAGSRRAADSGQAEPRFGAPSVSLQVGAVSCPASQPAALDLKGSDAMTLIST
jgi:hypothetical protein